MRWSGGQYWASDVYDLEFNLALIGALHQRYYHTTMPVCQSIALHSNIASVRIESSPDCVNANVNAESSACALCQRYYHTTLPVCQSNALHSSIASVRIESSPDCVNATVNAESSACALCQRYYHTTASDLVLICALRQRHYRTTLSVCQSNALHWTSIDAVRIESSLDCVNANVNVESSADNTGSCTCGCNQEQQLKQQLK